MSDGLRKPHGMFNATKCVQYLRWVGVEVTDEQAEAWLISERVHRFLSSQRKTVRECGACACPDGHEWYALTYRGRLTKKKAEANDTATKCPECGKPWTSWSVVWAETREGAIHDFRRKSEQWAALPQFEEGQWTP